MRRRDFLSQTIFIPVAGAVIAVLVTACSDDGSSDSTNPTGSTTTDDSSDDSSTTTSDDGTAAATCSDADIAIGGNHGHSLDVSSNQIEAGEALSLTLTGPHTHSLSLSAEQVASIAACGTVVATATGSGHTHEVTLTGIS